jgi:hypothetical protein
MKLLSLILYKLTTTYSNPFRKSESVPWVVSGKRCKSIKMNEQKVLISIRGSVQYEHLKIGGTMVFVRSTLPRI